MVWNSFAEYKKEKLFAQNEDGLPIFEAFISQHGGHISLIWIYLDERKSKTIDAM